MINNLADYSLRRNRPQLNCSEPLLTDQSQTPMSEINNILLQYSRTGMLPGIPNTQMTYVDDTTAPSFMDAHNSMVFAKAQFQKLPLSLRNELSHDYRQFEAWLSNPENFDRATKLGLLQKRETTTSNTLKAKNDDKLNNDEKAKGKQNSLETAEQS